MMLFTTNDLHTQHRTRALPGLLEKAVKNFNNLQRGIIFPKKKKKVLGSKPGD